MKLCSPLGPFILIVGWNVLTATENNIGQFVNELHGGYGSTGKVVVGDQNGEIRHTNSKNTAMTSAVSEIAQFHNMFDKYITDLGDLLAILKDPSNNWGTHNNISPSPPGATHHEENQVDDSDILGLFAFIGTAKRWRDNFMSKFEQNTQVLEGDSSRQRSALRSVEEKKLSNADDSKDLVEPAALSEGDSSSHQVMLTLKTALQELTQTFDRYFGQSTERSTVNKILPSEPKDGINALIVTLEALARGHNIYSNNFPNHLQSSESNYLKSRDNHAGLQKIVEKLKILVSYPQREQHVTTSIPANDATTSALSTTTTPTTTTTTRFTGI
nr:uncharacterized protein LOC128698692 [Cherax quadricarinatus]